MSDRQSPYTVQATVPHVDAICSVFALKVDLDALAGSICSTADFSTTNK
jgi:hypothetical protein